METMTITRGLRELKTLDARINKGIQELKTLDVRQNKYKGKALDTNQTIEEFEKNAKSGYESVSDLMEKRRKLKSGIMKANATTMVKIGDKEMTIAEVIEMRNSLPYKQELYRKLRTEFNTYQTKLQGARHNLDMQVEKLVEQNTGKDRKADKEDYDKIAGPFIEANEIHLVDPLKTEEIIKKLDEEITLIESDVDIVLSEINAKTEISI